MASLVTRFHLLLFAVILAMTGVALFRVPGDFAYPAHWTGSTPDWLWPRDTTLTIGPVLALVLLALFFVLGARLTRNHFAKTQHIFDPALTLGLSVIAATQFGLLMTGFGSDLDAIRLTGFALGAVLLVVGVVLFEAERHTYAGLRMPWPIASNTAWRLVHRVAGSATFLAGSGLLALAWLDAGIGVLIAGFAGALIMPALLAGVTSLLARR